MKKLTFILLLLIPVSSFSSFKQEVINANKLYKQFNYKEAANLYKQAFDHKHNYYLAIKLADTYFFDALTKPKAEKTILLNQALEAIKVAEEFKPNDAEVWARYARIYGQLSLIGGNRKKIKLAKTIKNYANKALALNPNQSTANAVLGVWEYELANLGSAQKTFAKIFYGKLPEGDYNKSLQYLNKAVKNDPQVVFFRLSLAKTLIKLGRDEEAKSQLAKALSLPNSVAADLIYKREIQGLLKNH